MFTAVEFRLIREKCPADFQKLLAMLNISEPNWNSSDEFRIYEKLDDEIVSKVCHLLKSNAVIVGYEKLIALGGLKFDYSKTDNEVLATIMQNKNAVMHGATQSVQSTQEKVVEPKPQKITKTVEKKILQSQFIVIGVVLVIIAIFLAVQDMTIGAIIAGVLGLASAAFGINGKTVTETITVDGNFSNKKSRVH